MIVMKPLPFRFTLSGVASMLSLMLALMGGAPAYAEDAQGNRLSQSIEGLEGVSEQAQTELLNQAMPQRAPALELYGVRGATDQAAKTLDVAPLTEQVFRIYDARTLLSGDDDGDGFYHQLRVIFDADVDHGDAYVYARLFLSYEGGPWNHYFTTDVFHILEESSYDDYEVLTRLLEGYPPGYYDVLIELYEADWDVHVASYGPYEDDALSAIPLEDLQEDSLDDVPVSDSHGGGGSIGLVGLLLLGLWRRRLA